MRRFTRAIFLILFAGFLAISAEAQWNPRNPVRDLRKDSQGLTLDLERGALRFAVCSEAVVRVLYAPEAEFPRVREYVVTKSDWPETPFSVSESADEVTLRT